VVFFVGIGVIVLATRWPLLRYVPVVSAVIMAAFRHYRHGTVSPELTWLIIMLSAIVLVRQFLGARRRRAAAAAAERMNANVRVNDTESRLGGDEFVVLLPRLIDDQIADTVAHRILRDLTQPLVIGETVLTIPASAGIAFARGSGIDLDEVMREADQALYQAEGKGVVRRFDPGQFAAAEERRRAEAELRRARVRGALPADRRPGRRACRGCRGAGALATPGARAARASRVPGSHRPVAPAVRGAAVVHSIKGAAGRCRSRGAGRRSRRRSPGARRRTPW
jgi:GGDEF domain-containing protein